MGLQVGFDDFGKVRTNSLDFVDKTLFVKEVLDDKNTEVSVITRPRRFGKTFNLSMLHHFLASEVNQIRTAGMFDSLKISLVNNGSYMQHQGKYPVIFVSFKEAKDKTFAAATMSLRATIQEVFRNHSYLLLSDKLPQNEKDLFADYFSGESRMITDLKTALRFLSELLYKHFSCPPYLLIDEYDTPIQSGYLNSYYDEIIDLMRGMFGAALKTNPYLARAVITGILRIAKESLFSGVNNLQVYSVLQPEYSQHFGFTEEEVSSILKQADLTDKGEDIKKWYNGYVFGGTTVYNPWSIVSCLKKRGSLQLYWGNTSDNDLIKTLIVESSVEFKEQFELLLQDKTISKIIDENMVFGDLRTNTQAAWSLLLMSGYLKIVSAVINDRGNTICECAIPNWEVKAIYFNIIESWLGNGQGIEWYQNFLAYLLSGNIEKFVENFGQVLLRIISVHDVAHNPEAFYHGFMLGLIAGIDQKQYELKSNRESGLGRYDIAIIPLDIKKIGIILELKSVVPPKAPKRTMAKVLDDLLLGEAQKALKQINSKQYTIDLAQKGVTNILKIGLAFCGKEFRAASERVCRSK
jgi:hypothetical protein